MTEQQLSKAKELQTGIEKQSEDIKTLKSLMWYGKSKGIIVKALKRFIYLYRLHFSYGAMQYDCDLSKDELRVLADYKAEKILKMKKELSELLSMVNCKKNFMSTHQKWIFANHASRKY